MLEIQIYPRNQSGFYVMSLIIKNGLAITIKLLDQDIAILRKTGYFLADTEGEYMAIGRFEPVQFIQKLEPHDLVINISPAKRAVSLYDVIVQGYEFNVFGMCDIGPVDHFEIEKTLPRIPGTDRIKAYFKQSLFGKPLTIQQAS